jgi:hypothetical protein
MPVPAQRVAAALLVLTLGACTAGASASPEAPRQETTTTTTEAPPTTPATTAPTTPPTTQPPPSIATTTPPSPATTVAPEEDEGSDVDWALIAIIVAGVVAAALLFGLISAAARRRSQAKGSLDRRISHLVGGAEWIHDQASLDLVGGTYTPARLRGAWEDTRHRMNDLGAEATALAVDAHDKQLQQELRYLSHALGLLAGALDTSVGLRLQEARDPGTAMAATASAEVVNQRRHDLMVAIVPLSRRV